jgi:histone H3/H4
MSGKGKGLGAGPVRLQKRDLRPAGLTHGTIHRFARKAAIKNMSKGMKVAAIKVNTTIIERIIQDAMIYTHNCKRKTVYPEDIAAALKLKGKTMVFF